MFELRAMTTEAFSTDKSFVALFALEFLFVIKVLNFLGKCRFLILILFLRFFMTFSAVFILLDMVPNVFRVFVFLTTVNTSYFFWVRLSHFIVMIHASLEFGFVAI